MALYALYARMYICTDSELAGNQHAFKLEHRNKRKERANQDRKEPRRAGNANRLKGRGPQSVKGHFAKCPRKLKYASLGP